MAARNQESDSPRQSATCGLCILLLGTDLSATSENNNRRASQGRNRKGHTIPVDLSLRVFHVMSAMRPNCMASGGYEDNPRQVLDLCPVFENHSLSVCRGPCDRHVSQERKNRGVGGAIITDKSGQNTRNPKQVNVAPGEIVNTRKDGT